MTVKVLLTGAVILAASAVPGLAMEPSAPEAPGPIAAPMDGIQKGFGDRVPVGYYRRPYRNYYPRGRPFGGYYRGYRGYRGYGGYRGYRGYPRVYPAPAVPVYRPGPPEVVYGRPAYRAWSPEWYSYCSSTYRTFNAQTGYYYYAPGRQRFCLAGETGVAPPSPR